MKILVTGASGFIGKHIIAKLLERGHSVTAIARDLLKVQDLHSLKNIRFIAGDIHTDTLVDKIGSQDVLIHLAWSNLPNYKELFHFEENLPGDYRFLKLLIENGIKQLLVTGTCFEYGLQNGCLSETLPTYPANSYALAKDTLRKFLEALQLKHTFILQWARLFYIYGEGQNSNSLFAQLDRAIESGHEAFNMSGGEQLRDYLPVEDIAQYVVILCEHPEINGIINLCSGKPISIRHLVEQHIAKCGAKISLNLGYYDYNDYEPMAFWGDHRKLLRLLNLSQ